jgi:hypothetical protein
MIGDGLSPNKMLLVDKMQMGSANYRGLPNGVTDSTKTERRPRGSGDPVSLVQKTLDSLPAFAGTKGRGNDDIWDPSVTHFRNAQ